MIGLGHVNRLVDLRIERGVRQVQAQGEAQAFRRRGC